MKPPNKSALFSQLFIFALLSACSLCGNETPFTGNKTPASGTASVDGDPLHIQILKALRQSDSVLPPVPPVHPVSTVYNREAIVPPQCYTRTEGTYERKGKEGFFECHLLPDMRDEGVVGYYVMTFDITERKQAEMRSASSERRLRGLTDNVPALLTELDLEDANPQRVRRRLEWKIGDFRPTLSEGTAIEYWIEAEDNNNATGPGIASSEHQLAKVVSEAEKRADLLNRAGDTLGSITDVTTDQEKLNRNLGTIIREKTNR